MAVSFPGVIGVLTPCNLPNIPWTMYLARLAALALGLIGSPITAQVDSPPPVERPTRVLSHTFVTPSREFVRVRLVSTESYRAVLSHPQARLEVRPVSQGIQKPRVLEGRPGQKQRIVIIEPRVTAEYEIRVLAAGRAALRLTIDRRVRKPPR